MTRHENYIYNIQSGFNLTFLDLWEQYCISVKKKSSPGGKHISCILISWSSYFFHGIRWTLNSLCPASNQKGLQISQDIYSIALNHPGEFQLFCHPVIWQICPLLSSKCCSQCADGLSDLWSEVPELGAHSTGQLLWSGQLCVMLTSSSLWI